MIIFVRKTLKEHISRVETSERGIGLLGFGVSSTYLHPHFFADVRSIGKQSGELAGNQLARRILKILEGRGSSTESSRHDTMFRQCT